MGRMEGFFLPLNTMGEKTLIGEILPLFFIG
jgi:hypothetical protein